jgi:hypothetical protein
VLNETAAGNGEITYNIESNVLTVVVRGQNPVLNVERQIESLKSDLLPITEYTWKAKLYFEDIESHDPDNAKLVKEMTEWGFAHGCNCLELHFENVGGAVKEQLSANFSTYFEAFFCDDASAKLASRHTIVQEQTKGFFSINLLD